MKILTSVILFFACSVLSVFSQDESAKDNTETSPEVLSEEKYSMLYPETWTLDQSRQLGTEFYVFSPLDSDKDTFSDNLNLIIQDLSGHELDLAGYTAITLEQMKSQMENSQVLLSEERLDKRHNTPFQELIYTAKSGDFDLKFRQFYWILDEKAYIITFTAEEETFESYTVEMEMMMESFEIVN